MPMTFGQFLAMAANDCVEADHGQCRDCSGLGRVKVHVCRDDHECKRLCPKVETCMACLGTGKAQPKKQLSLL